LDYDNDGRLDIYVVNGSTYDALTGKATPPHAALLHNNHDGTFTDVTGESLRFQLACPMFCTTEIVCVEGHGLFVLAVMLVLRVLGDQALRELLTAGLRLGIHLALERIIAKTAQRKLTAFDALS
jgi:hypothetical protein